MIPVNSYSYAFKGEKQLRKNGIRVSVARVDPSKTPKGCSYGLVMDCKDANAAYPLLKRAEIPFSDALLSDDIF